MRKTFASSISVALSLAVTICVTAGMIQGCSNTQSSQPTNQAKAQPTQVTCADAEAPANFPPVPNVIDKTCAVIPLDFNGIPNQQPADLYSWLTFVAVNWPVDPTTCTADPNASILSGPQNPTWLTYLSNDEVFVPAKKSPENWCHAPQPAKAGAAAFKFESADAAATARRNARLAQLPPKVRALAEKHPEVQLFLHHNAKGQDLFTSITHFKGAATSPQLKDILDATNQPVTDQNGRFVRYTINLGEDEYSYIMAQNLWTAAGQKAAKDLSFPFSKQNSATELGAMEFKAAWKILGANDNSAHFFTQQAIVYNDESGAPSPGPNPVTVGLVGLHITHKTEKQHKWLWATFEQVENDTQSFFNPNCKKDCTPNTQYATKPYFELNPNGTPHNPPVQVVPAVQTTAASLNKTFSGMLANTPWAYYSLVSTQWVGEAGSGAKPAKLGNSVLETFVKQVQPYSCMDCHNFAHDTAGFKSDFSFIMHAQQ
ncbi:MAG TPA: hypothetical protein VFB76_06960 [Candidatus Angelobacter sp.]|nr:hypothetical protein [Candidatus Angelobacter sp.]